MAQQQRRYKIGEQVETNLRAWTTGRSKEKNTPYIRLLFDGYISKDLWITKSNEEWYMKTLELLGFKYDSLAGIKEPDALDKEKIVSAVIEEEREYNGKYYYQASFINATGIDCEITDDLLSEFRGIDTRAYIKGATPAQGAGESTQGVDGNFTAKDIPF